MSTRQDPAGERHEHCGRIAPTFTRREALRLAGGGMGMLALNTLLAQSGLATPGLATPGSATPGSAVAARRPAGSRNWSARADSVIWLFMNGGPSHLDTFDYKPALARATGQTLAGFDNATAFFDQQVGPLLGSPFPFRQHGESGAWVSSLFPHLARQVDKIAFLKSFRTRTNNHSPAMFMANTGVPRMGRPCVGSWVTYGLGTENRNLPAFVVMSDPLDRGLPKGHAANWSNGFLPGAYQGAWLQPKGAPIANLDRPAGQSDRRQRRQLDLLQKLNAQHHRRRPFEPDLAARIESFELAYRMQSEAPDCFELDGEPDSIHELYGTRDERCAHFGRQCLLARRLVERGVRFVQIYSGGTANSRSWDGHNDIRKNHSQFAGETDRPIAGLLADLDQRGLLDRTLVVWGGEFGRLPVSQLSDGEPTGRDHNPHAGCYWMAGGGIRGGVSYGETDELGHKAVTDPIEIHDIHATLLHLLGLDHERLTYLHNGRRYRLTDVAGRVLREVLA